MFAYAAAPAQDGHYWTEQFGARSILLSGVVTGSVDDLGAVYYNPARLAQIENPAFLLSGKVYQYNRLRIENGGGNNIDLVQSDFNGVPGLVSGTFKLGFMEGHRWAYALMKRHNFNVDFFVHDEDRGDLIESWPGDETYSGQFNFSKSLNEEWAGLSWAYPLSDHLSIGASTFLTIRNQGESLSTQIQVLSDDNEVVMLNTTRGADFKSVGLLWKLSMAYARNNFTAGLTLTTPNIRISGTGSTNFQDFYSGPKGLGGGKLKDLFVDDYQSDLHAQHRAPLSIALGAGYRLGKHKIHANMEWFDRIPRYVIMQSAPFEGESNGRTYQVTLVDELEPVINFGIGAEVYINENYSSFISFATDFSAVPAGVTQYIEPNSEANGSMIQADIYHLGGGLIANTRWFEVTLGAGYAFASQNINRPFQFPESEDDLLADPDQQSRLYLGRWKFILGFTVPFIKEKVDNLTNE